MRDTVTIRSGTAEAATNGEGTDQVYTDDLDVPGFARWAIFYLDVTAMSGTSEAVDWKLQYVDPGTGTAEDFPGAGITQLTAAANVIVNVGAGITGIADDDTGVIYSINAPLPQRIRSVLTLANSAENEVQTIDLGDFGAADTFTLTWDGNATDPITHDTDISTDIDTALEALAGIAVGDISVSRTSETVYVVTFEGALAEQDVSAITITDATGFTPTGVTETNAGVAPDEEYTYSLTYEVGE